MNDTRNKSTVPAQLPLARTGNRQATRRAPTELALGFDHHDVRHYVTPNQRSRHHLIVGLSGTGKSRYMEHQIRHDIVSGYGVCVLDPKGNNPDSVFNNTLKWLHAKGYCDGAPDRPQRTVRIIDLSSRTHVTALDPFHVPDDIRENADPAKIADDLMKIFERVWDQDFVDRPLIYRLLRSLFIGLYEHRLTLSDIPHLFGRTNEPETSETAIQSLRANFVDTIKHDVSRINLQALHDLSQNKATERRFEENLMGPLNRLEPFIGTRLTSRMFSGGGTPLDLRRVMDNGEILLVNLAADTYTVSPQAARLVGTYLVYEFFRLSKNRHTIPRRQFFLYIDEAANFLTEDVAQGMDECRSEGLSFVLALQRLQQALSASENIHNAVLSEPNILSIFGGLEMDEAARMVDNIVKLDLEIPIQATIKPTQTGQFDVVEMRSGSETASDGLSQTAMGSSTKASADFKARSFGGSEGVGHGMSASEAQSMSTIIGPDGSPIVVMSSNAGTSNSYSNMSGWGEVQGMSTSQATTVGEATTRSLSHGRTTGTTETLKPIFADMVSGVHTKDNVRHAAAWELRTQQPRHFFLSVDRQSASRLAVPDVQAPPLSPADLEAFKVSLYERDPSAITVKAADRGLRTRRRGILERVMNPELAASPRGKDVSAPPPEPVDDPAPMPHQPRDDEPDLTNVTKLFPDNDDK